MSTTLLLDFELVNHKHSVGHTRLTAEHLELYQGLFSSFTWAKKLFCHAHVGHWDQSPTQLTPFTFNDNLLALAADKTIFHVLSDAFSQNTALRFEDRHLILALGNNRCTLCIPLWLLRHHHLETRCAEPFLLLEITQQLITTLLTHLPSDIFLRRANLRVLGLNFRHYRPEFEYFYLSENSIMEWLNTHHYSVQRAAPEYLASLATLPDFLGVEHQQVGDYLFMQWMDNATTGDGWQERHIATALSQRHIWLGHSQCLPRHSNFNALGDKQYMQSAKPLLKPPHMVKAGGGKAFILLSTQETISKQDWQTATDKIQALRKNNNIRQIDLVVANRRLCFEWFHRIAEIDATNIAYLDGTNLFTPFPTGRWLNDSHGELSTCYTVDDARLTQLGFVQSPTYLLQELRHAVLCFKRHDTLFQAHWLLRGGKELSVIRINEATDSVLFNEGFGVGDWSEFSVCLSDGAIIQEGEAVEIEVIRLLSDVAGIS